jgi:hypothetical protein
MPEKARLPHARLPGKEDEAGFAFKGALELAVYQGELRLPTGKIASRGTARRLIRNS